MGDDCRMLIPSLVLWSKAQWSDSFSTSQTNGRVTWSVAPSCDYRWMNDGCNGAHLLPI